MYNYEIKPELQRTLNKLFKKDRQLYEQIMNKIEEVVNIQDADHYKNLRYPLEEYKRVHIGHFVLLFIFLKKENKISFTDFDHHDNTY